MNDRFLYQLRTEPPPHFAAQLKERLDRGSKRTARVLGLGLCIVLFGSAFAMVSPTVRTSVAAAIDWIRGTPAPTVAVPDEVNQGLARAFGARKVAGTEGTTASGGVSSASGNGAKEGASELLEQVRVRQARAAEREVPGRSAAPDSGTHSGAPTGADDDAHGTPNAPSRSSFIVTGPLLPEEGMPSYVFDARRAYFTVIRLTADPLIPMLTRRAPLDAQIAQNSARRLELLASMMPEMFAKDERGGPFGVPTRAEPRIWNQPDEFGREIDGFTAATRALSTSIGSRNVEQIRARFVNVGHACTSCHQKFRKGGSKDVGAVYP